MYLLQDSTSTFIQHKVLQEQAHMYFTFEKPLQNLSNSLFLTQNVVSLLKLWLFSLPLREKGILFYREQFLTTFKKTITEQLAKQQIDFGKQQVKRW